MNPSIFNEKSSILFSQLFPQFDQALIEELLRVRQVTEFKKGQILMRTGQYFKYPLLILEGTVKLHREGQEGEEFFLYYLEKGNACALSMICATKNEAIEIKALAIPLPHMDHLMKNYRNWYYFVLETYRSRFEELLQVIDQVAFYAMDEMLEFYLKRQFHAFNSDTLTKTHQQITDDLDSSREVISRLLKKLEAGKRIIVSRFAIKNINL